MSGFWWYITVTLGDMDAPVEQAEEILNSAAEISGCIGTEIQELPDMIRMRIYYRADEEISHWRERLLSALREWDKVRIEDMGKIENQPWYQKSEEAFPPLEVGRGFVVLAPWHRGAEPSDRIAIYINPGSAFGTGYHESTQTALELLERRAASGGSIDDAIDVGSGSGILSIAALKLGARHALARDIDPAVIDEIAANAELNDIDKSQLSVETGDLLCGVDGMFDLLFANILLEPNTMLLPDVPRILKPGGEAIFSGMTVDESERFLAAMRETTLVPVEELVIGDWWGVRAKDKA